MVSPVSNTSHSIPISTIAKSRESAAKGSNASPKQAASTTVTLSAAAQAAATAVKEATETAAQTAQEAAHGDLQAQRLEARAAATKAYSG